MGKEQLKTQLKKMAAQENPNITSPELMDLSNKVMYKMGLSRKMVLTYDTNKEQYDKENVKNNLLEFLEKDKKAFNLMAITDSVVFFDTTISNPFNQWKLILKKYADEHNIHFTLSLIEKASDKTDKMVDSDNLF